jgi:hypothetical protein
LYDEEMTRAHGTLRTGGGFKAAANIVGTQFSLAWWPIEWALDKTHIYEEKPAEVLDPTTEEKEKSFYLPDRFAHDKAYHGYQERKAAIETLTKAVKAGLDKEETWAVTLDVEETLKKLDPKIQEILQVNLDLKAKWEIVKKTDVKEQEKARLEYAKAEQQWWLDFGGGNATSRNWSNWTGGINNFKYAVGELNYLASKATDPEVKENARNALAAMGYGTDDTDTWYEAIFFGKHYNSEQESRLFGRTLNYGLMAYFGRGPIHTTRTRFGEGIKWTGRGLGNMSKAGTKAVIGEERATRWGEAIVESRLGDAGRGIKRGMESLGKRWENRKWFRLPFKDARQRFAQKHPKLSGDWKIFDGFLSLALTDQLLDPEPYKPINTWNRNVDRTPWPDPEVLSPEEQNFENRTLGKATNK